MDGWIGECLDGWNLMNQLKDGYIDRYLYRWMDGKMDGWMNLLMDMDSFVDLSEKMDRWMELYIH